MVAIDGLPPFAAVIVFVSTFASSAALAYLVRAVERDSIASIRRIFGLAFSSNLLWALTVDAGSLLAWVQHDHQPSTNEFVLGFFLAWSFEVLVVNGAFVPSTVTSVCIAAMQPTATWLLASAFMAPPDLGADYAAVLGLAVLGLIVGFLLKFKTFKTEGAGITSLQTFQSFLKSWVAQKPGELEKYFTMYSRDEPVTTRIVLATAADRLALVLPGVHPGPFFPVGSYNESELIFHELRKVGVAGMVLHGVGGHERNLPTNDLAKRYAVEVARAAAAPSSGMQVGTIKGPLRFKMGPTQITALAFGSEVMTFLSNAPYNTDDLEPAAVDEALSAARAAGTELMLIDAHNSIGGENSPQLDIDWKTILSATRDSPEAEFDIGVAHSSEVQFRHGSDISDGGITVLVIRKLETNYTLVASDSNNAVIGLRQRLIDDLGAEHIELIELCTSDTHNSAARSLSDRGYHALGEDTDQAELVSTIKKLEKMAESRLAHGRVTTITSQLTLPLIGAKSIKDFAALTSEALDFAKGYAKIALASVLIICLLALFL